jgi:hypothetical protein
VKIFQHVEELGEKTDLLRRDEVGLGDEEGRRGALVA